MRIYQTTLLVVFLIIFASLSWSEDVTKGRAAYDSAQYETALNEWQPLAEAGDAESQFGMGQLYANGYGVPLDDAQALKWYGLAADQGHPDAECNLAVMHANGWGVPQSDAEAAKWFELAAQHGVPVAQVNLGKMYTHGFGTEQSYVQAYKWFSIASDLGDVDALQKRDEIVRQMSPEEIAAASGLVSAWFDSYQNQYAASEKIEESVVAH